MSDQVTFYLPLGLDIDGKVYRRGKMHLATTKDELDLQDDDQSSFNVRYRDIALLAKVIDELDGLRPVTVEMIKDLYEVDFIYLQLLYRQLNGDVGSQIRVKCPDCNAYTSVSLSSLYGDMSIYEE